MRRSAGTCILLAIFVVVGCNPFAGWQTETVDVTVVMQIPAYDGGPPPGALADDPDAAPGARMVDPSTWTVDITVSGSGFDAIEATFSFGEHGSYSDGTGLIECLIEGVPAGPDRVFDVVTRDSDGTVLTTGSATASVSAATETVVELNLLPAVCTDMTAPVDETPQTLESTVDSGRMRYIRVSDFAAGTYEVRLTATDDLNLFVFSSDGSILVNDVCVAGAPTDECAELVLAAGTALYAGVYGAAAGEALPFTLTVTRVGGGEKLLTGTVTLELDGHDVSEVEGETLSVALLEGDLEGELVTVASWSGAWGSATTMDYEMEVTGVPDGDYYLSASIGSGLCSGWYHSSGGLFLVPSDPEFETPNFTLAPPYQDADFPVGFTGGGGSFVAVPLPDINDTGPAYPLDLTVYDGTLHFTADDGVHGRELWRYSFSAEHERLSDINPSGDAFALFGNAYLTVFDGDLYFRADDGTHGVELWRYDGASVTRISDIAAGAGDSIAGCMVVYDDGDGEALYLRATDDGSDYDLWRYDGAGAPVLACELPGSMLSGQPVVYNGEIFFTAMDASFGSELWRCDGSTPLRVSDINVGAAHSGVQSLTVVGSTLYFAATDGSGYELWEYDGTTVALAADVNLAIDGADTGGSMPTDLCAYGGDLYFTAATVTYGRELYRYDGASVALVADIAPGGTNSSQPSGTTAISFGVISSASESGFEPMNREPWFSSGTGAVLAAEVNPIGDGDPSSFTELGGAIYFSACDYFGDYELWLLTY